MTPHSNAVTDDLVDTVADADPADTEVDVHAITTPAIGATA